MANAVEISSGVQELIEKLRNQGVAAGQEQANQIVKEAQIEASRIIAHAKTEAEKLLNEARDKIETEHTSAHEAINIAFRDTELALRSTFRDAFTAHLKRLVSSDLRDKDFIKQLVLAVAGIKAPELTKSEKLDVLLPAELFEKGKDHPHLSQEGKKKLHRLTLGISNEMLREGVELKPSSDISGGVRVRLVGEDLEIDFTDEAFSNLLLKYLLPRYREIVSGQAST